ncbi:hypothetical protein L218DRAFT_903553, partial [Marasmius fiardii PR-910]
MSPDSPRSSSFCIPYTSLHYEHDKNYHQAQFENRGRFVELAPARFLQEFFPVAGTSLQMIPDARAELKKAAACKIEVDSYKHLLSFELYSPTMKFFDSHYHPAEFWYENQPVEIKPDISSCLKTLLPPPASSAPLAPRPPPEKGQVNLTEAEVMVEVKFAPGDDPFRDKGPYFETRVIQGRDTRGQITMYATPQLAEQHRTHCFSVVIIGTYARIIRWDRAGVVVTSKFNYVKARWLAMFFHMYGSAKPEVRGVDTSVSSFDKEFDDHHLQWQEQAREHLSLDSSQPLFLFEVHNAETKECKKLVAARPFIRNNHSLTGRCTRCYKVWDPETKQVLLMKDTWRVTEKGVMEEGAVYSLLKKEGVRNILTVVTYGDVL